MKSKFTESIENNYNKNIIYNLLRIIVSVCLIAMTTLIRTRQDLFVYENGNMGSMSPELIAILIVGMILDWKKIYHVILILLVLSSLFHLIFIGIADHMTGKLIIMSIELVIIILLIIIIRFRKEKINDAQHTI